jgi:hypothetical protein
MPPFLFWDPTPWILPATIFLLIVATLVVVWLALLFAPTIGRTVMLECPHCGKPTPSNRPECEACGRSFRDTVKRASAARPGERRT